MIDDEQLMRHTLILGKTGTGKSYLLSNLIDKLSGVKRLIIFDMHGELWKYGRKDSDIIALRTIEEQSTGYLKFNILGVMPYRNEFEKLMNEDLTIQSLKDIFSREETYSQGTWGPRIELVFTVLPKLLLKYKINPTLEDLLKILLDPYERRDFLSSLESEDKLKYYSIFNSQGYDFISSTINKIMPILSNEISKRAFSSKFDSIDFSNLDRDIYIILSPEYSSSLIAKQFAIMLLYKIWNNLIMRRMQNVTIVIDEFQILSPNIIEKFLTEGRKFGLNLISATQTLSLLNSRISNIIKTNVSNVISFRGSEEEQKFLTGGDTYLTSEHEFEWFDTFSMIRFKGKLRYIKRQEREFIISKKYYSFEDSPDFNEDSWKDPYYSNLLASLNLVRIENNKIIPTEDYMKVLNSRKVKGKESIYHRYLITKSYLYFKSAGYKVYENIVLQGGIPDLVVFMEEKEFAVECEYSDISNPKRIEEKIKRYEDLILVTFKGYENRLPDGLKVLLIPPIGEIGEIERINF